MNEDRWYFAYGSNLSTDQKEERTGQIRRAIHCYIEGYRFVFNKRGSRDHVYANIVPNDGAKVWGVIYLCNPKAIERMDRYEGVANGHYDQISVTVTLESGETVEAITYVAGKAFTCDPGKPQDAYLAKIISGARKHQLPEDYISAIELLAK